MRSEDGSGPLPVKICGLTRREDALAAERAGAAFLGVVLSSGFGRSVARELAPALLEGTTTPRVAVLVDEIPSRAAELAAAMGAAVVQLHGRESPDDVVALRGLGPWKIWKAVRVRADEDVTAAASEYAGIVDGLLLEGWKPGLVGGGGAVLSASPERVREDLPGSADFVLAGGLTPETVGEAVRAFRPDVVDVSSGVESAPGRKDEDRMRRFVEAVRGALVAVPSEPVDGRVGR